MFTHFRKTIWLRLAAAGFISLIIIGNIWVTMTLTGASHPSWLFYAFYIALTWTMFQVAMVLIGQLKAWISKYNTSE